jgi:hypothetical protein
MKKAKHIETRAGSFQGVIITNNDVKKIKTKVVYDENFRILRINIGLKKKKSKVFMGDYYE